MPRPEVLSGYTSKIKTGCASIFLTLNFDEEGNPFELFINSAKSAGCSGLHQSLSRTITLCFRNKINIDDIIETLEGVTCPACTRAKAKLEKDEIVDFPKSCGDACSRFLKRIKNKVGE